MLDLEPIKKRLAAAPEGPWSDFCESGDWWIQQVDAAGNPIGLSICDANDISASVMMLIAHAPADIAALIEEVERVRTALSELVWGCENGGQRPSPAFSDARRVLGDRDPLRLICGSVDEEE